MSRCTAQAWRSVQAAQTPTDCMLTAACPAGGLLQAEQAPAQAVRALPAQQASPGPARLHNGRRRRPSAQAQTIQGSSYPGNTGSRGPAAGHSTRGGATATAGSPGSHHSPQEAVLPPRPDLGHATQTQSSRGQGAADGAAGTAQGGAEACVSTCFNTGKSHLPRTVRAFAHQPSRRCCQVHYSAMERPWHLYRYSPAGYSPALCGCCACFRHPRATG